MKSRFVTLLVFASVILGVSVTVFPSTVEIIDPHEEPATCRSCHDRIPAEEDAQSGDLYLLAETIDDTCHMCHPYDCCRIGALTGHNHPSNVSKWDVEKFTVPKKLPLHDGLITCNTCHYHRENEATGGKYKMVRMVKVTLDRVDWTALCLDCHVDY